MSQPTALVIDDDETLAILFKSALEMQGFQVEQVTDSLLAMGIIKTSKPDVIMLDMQMPDVSGVDILKAVRADDNLKHIKIVMVTANGLAAQDETINALVDLLLIKPVSLKQITDFASRLTQSSNT